MGTNKSVKTAGQKKEKIKCLISLTNPELGSVFAAEKPLFSCQKQESIAQITAGPSITLQVLLELIGQTKT